MGGCSSIGYPTKVRIANIGTGPHKCEAFGGEHAMWYVYVLYSKAENRFYIGFTHDLRRRIGEHKRGKTKTTSHMVSWRLAYYEACLSEQDAQIREKQLKTGFGRGYLRRRLAFFLKGV